MKEIIHLAEEFRKIGMMGHLDKDLKAIGVEYNKSLDLIHMGPVARHFLKKPELHVPDELLFCEESRNIFLEDFTLKLNTIKSIVKELREKCIEEKIVELQEELKQVAA